MSVIQVYPKSPTAIQDAIHAANPGDIIFVHQGIYHEAVQVPSEKSHIRILAKEPYAAVMNGSHGLTTAFSLNNVSGVEINGFTIKNYRSKGISISGGSSSRVLHNHIRHLVGESSPMGIVAHDTDGLLMMNNYMERVGDTEPGVGIQLVSVTGAWVIMNRVRNSTSNGVEVIDSFHNALVSNRITNSKMDGIHMRGSNNNLIFQNKIYRNGQHGVNVESSNNYLLGDKIKFNRGSGVVTLFDHNLASFNQIERNRLSGVKVSSNYNDIQDNLIKHNRNHGVLIETDRTANLVYDNRIKRNKSHNNQDLGVNNNVWDNKIKK